MRYVVNNHNENGAVWYPFNGDHSAPDYDNSCSNLVSALSRLDESKLVHRCYNALHNALHTVHLGQGLYYLLHYTPSF